MIKKKTRLDRCFFKQEEENGSPSGAKVSGNVKDSFKCNKKLYNQEVRVSRCCPNVSSRQRECKVHERCWKVVLSNVADFGPDALSLRRRFGEAAR